jgi:hypothetical protein
MAKQIKTPYQLTKFQSGAITTPLSVLRGNLV